MRDKLIELLTKQIGYTLPIFMAPQTIEILADALIANGVTVQQWIPVSERLPEIDGSYLVRINSRGKYYKVIGYCHNLTLVDSWDFEGCNRGGWFNYDSEVGYYEVAHVTHWMPIPQTFEEREINDTY